MEAAAYLFEKENDSHLSKSHEEFLHSFFDNKMSTLEVKEIIIEAIKEDKIDEPLKNMAFWALGKLFDASLKPFFVRCLKSAVRTADHPCIYQLMIALDNLGENIFTKKIANSLEEEENLFQAKEYLQKNY